MDPQERKLAIDSLEQLLTVSCILAGFAFSGLIALPGIEIQILNQLSQGVPLAAPDLAFRVAYYAMFFSTLLFLGAILIILVYQTSNFQIPSKKLRSIQVKVSILFSFAIGCLIVSVCALGLPGKSGIIVGAVMGVVVTTGFVRESWLARRKAGTSSDQATEVPSQP